ncbi:hypothetical protein OIO90_001212 [Microbotryomycetes sp. JL221]|nr:hypothetical protein OIO90_001212 [Microbotryomycetes sp. JL221]
MQQAYTGSNDFGGRSFASPSSRYSFSTRSIDPFGGTTSSSLGAAGRRTSSNPAQRRQTRRLLILFGILVVVLVLDGLYLHRLIFDNGPNGGRARAAQAHQLHARNVDQVERELVELLVRHKQAYDMQPPVDRIQDFADRFKVLLDLDKFQTNLDNRGLNDTSKELYTRSTQHHFDQLFAKLFPYVSKSPKRPRTFNQLRQRYTIPRGIIIPCGNEQFRFAVHLIATLKNVHHTKLPITVVHAGNNDLSIERRAALRSISPDVETFDILHFFDEDFVGLDGGGWAIKVFTIIASQFQETIICDADVIFLQDPQVLFDNPRYNQTGTLFFRDREIFPGDGNVHQWWSRIMEGRQPSQQLLESRWFTDQASREEMESGVVVFDKRRRDVSLGLIFTGYLNIKSVREPVTYAQTYGDKESFWMSFELAGIPYHFQPEYAGIVGQLTHPDAASHSIDSRICSEHMFHLDWRGRPLWWNGSLFQNKRSKNKGWFIATHWAPGTVDWDCEPEPWCMKGIREQDVKKLADADGFDRVLSDMIGAAVVVESRFPGLLPQD